jgi:hypothetical protein
VHRVVALTALIGLLGFAPDRVAAQHEDPEGEPAHPNHGTTFSTGTREGWTFSTPHLDINGGLFYMNTSPATTQEAFFRLHAQTAFGIHYLQLSSDLLWIPQFGATPVWSGVLEVSPIQQESPFYVAAGIGLISGRNQNGDKLSGWLQGTVAFRTPIHEITPFVQIGKALSNGNQAELLFGIAHPLAPYKLHLP